MLENKNLKEFNDESKEITSNIKKVKINGPVCNIIFLTFLFPVLGLIILIKFFWMKESFPWDSLDNIFKGIISFVLILLFSLILHELIKYLLYKIFNVHSIKIKIKDFMFFLYSKQELTVKQAKALWLVPYLIFIPFLIISIIFFNFFIAFSFSLMLIGISDDLIMYFHLLKFNNQDIFIQEEKFLGFKCIIMDRKDTK